MTPDLFGNVRPLEPANVYVLPTKTLADEIRAELRLAASIRRDPFSHLPAKIMPPSWARIVSSTSRNVRHHYLDSGAEPYKRLWGANNLSGGKI